MKTNPLKEGFVTENYADIGTVTPEMVRERAVELAAIDSRSAQDVSQSDWEHAKRELTGDSDTDPNESAIESAPESERWDSVHGSTHILARLETGLRTNAARLQELEEDLTVALQRARHFGQEHGSPDDWNTHWHQRWDHVEEILRRIRVLVIEMCGSIESSDSDRLKKALETWETIQTEDAKLVEALSAIRVQMSGLNAADRKDWNIVARTLEGHLETIHACAQTLRIKLELLKKHPREDVDRVVQDILSKLPNRTHADGMDSESHEQEYGKAANELEEEHYKFLGFVDVAKSLLMWFESTEERVRKNRSLRVDEA